MTIHSLHIHNFRNIENAQLIPHRKCNLFYGQNGSGKTSILEAIHYLGLGRSFRCHLVSRVINQNAPKFSVYGKIATDSDRAIALGIERGVADQHNQIKIDGENIKSSAELAKLLPLQLLNQNAYYFFEHGPKARRQFIDWGVFHVEHSFFSIWKRAEQILTQRTALLRAKKDLGQISYWDSELSELSHKIHKYREAYLKQLFALLDHYLSLLLPEFEISIAYHPGWNISESLSSALSASLNKDLQLGYTSIGPHRADLTFRINHIPAQDVLSRGQTKMLLYALKFAQGKLLQNITNSNCTFLIDDLTSELDNNFRSLLVTLINDLDSQFFVTGLDKNFLQSIFSGTDCQLFHVERGEIIMDN
jgi:DNA replication and repair protein RecF